MPTTHERGAHHERESPKPQAAAITVDPPEPWALSEATVTVTGLTAESAYVVNVHRDAGTETITRQVVADGSGALEAVVVPALPGVGQFVVDVVQTISTVVATTTINVVGGPPGAPPPAPPGPALASVSPANVASQSGDVVFYLTGTGMTGATEVDFLAKDSAYDLTVTGAALTLVTDTDVHVQVYGGNLLRSEDPYGVTVKTPDGESNLPDCVTVS